MLPPALDALGVLASNLRWSWHEPTKRLFREMSAELWESTGHDPVALLGAIGTDRLRQLADDRGFVELANGLRSDLEVYLREPRWYQSLGDDAPTSIAYFSPEYGIAASLPQYSGGLGILAGDHLKAASDLGVPLVAVGLFYRAGYFSQSLSAEGWQKESYPVLDADGLPVQLLRNADGTPVVVTLAMPDGGALSARVWRAEVGRVPLLLLDTDIPENTAEYRAVTDRLYGGDTEHRLRQELLLGIGGVRAVEHWCDLSDVTFPTVFHTNEGHAGFLGLERISSLIGQGLSFAEALEVVRAGTVFTTHTPVPAGIDRFDRGLVARYLEGGDLLPGVDPGDALALGAEPGDGGDGGAGGEASAFNMAFMGLRLAQRANGVSELHGDVSRGMFQKLWPGFEQADVPIGSITNGVHAATWTDSRMVRLAEERFGTTDTTSVDWQSDALSDDDLWRVRREMKQALVADARERERALWLEQNRGGITPDWIDQVLDPDVLTIGFARRVPTYKRLTLMLHDQERLTRILTDPDRPVQIVVAGKSHPHDEDGKRLIQKLVEFAQQPAVRGRIVFLTNYDIRMAQVLYPGTDVWLNNPLRPLEACGTSGMKAAMNGSLNLSILDGWWNEYFDGVNGWAIPTAPGEGASEERDLFEANALYDLLETRVVPEFYDRGDDGVPRAWMSRVRHSLAHLSPELSAERMVREYVENLYVPAARSRAALAPENPRPARELAAWKQRVRGAWPGVAVAHVESGGLEHVPQVDDVLRLRARIRTAGLSSDELSVQVVYGAASFDGELTSTRVVELRPAGGGESGETVFEGEVRLVHSGGFGYTVRVLPRHPLLAAPAELGLIAHADDAPSDAAAEALGRVPSLLGQTSVPSTPGGQGYGGSASDTGFGDASSDGFDDRAHEGHEADGSEAGPQGDAAHTDGAHVDGAHVDGADGDGSHGDGAPSDRAEG